MDRLKGTGSFLWIAAGAFLLLRLVHVALPLVYPPSAPGPFHLADVAGGAR